MVKTDAKLPTIVLPNVIYCSRLVLLRNLQIKFGY